MEITPSRLRASTRVEKAEFYISESAMVISGNLEAPGDNLFINRLPFTCKEDESTPGKAVRGGVQPLAAPAENGPALPGQCPERPEDCPPDLPAAGCRRLR